MKTGLIILLILAAGVIVYLMFNSPILPDNSEHRATLWNEITDLTFENDSLIKEGIEKDSIIRTYKADSIKLNAHYKARLKYLQSAPRDTIRVISHNYIDTTLTKDETQKEISKLGFKYDNCKRQSDRKTLQITRLNARIADLKIIINNSKTNNMNLRLLTQSLEEDKKQTAKAHKKQLRKTKWIAAGVSLAAVGLAFLAAIN